MWTCPECGGRDPGELVPLVEGRLATLREQQRAMGRWPSHDPFKVAIAQLELLLGDLVPEA